MSVLIDTCDGQLTIDGVSMHTPAWNVLRLLDLWLGGRQRGEDRLLPLTAGVIPYQRRHTVTAHSLPMVVRGEVDENGIAFPDYWIGLETNIDTLRAAVVDPTGVGDGTRPATLVMPSGAVRTADIHVLDIIQGVTQAGTNVLTGEEGVGMLCTLEISIPAGVFA